MKRSHGTYGKELEGVSIAHAATFGGMIANFGRNMARMLSDMGAELHFIASSRPIYGLAPPIPELEQLGGRFHGIEIEEGVSALHTTRAMLNMVKLLRSLQVNVLHTRGSIMGLIGRMAGRIAGVPLIFHHQDELFARDDRHCILMRNMVGWTESAMSRLSHKTFFVSDTVLEDALNFGFKKESCVVVGNDLHSAFLRRQDEVRKKEGLGESYIPRLGFPRTD